MNTKVIDSIKRFVVDAKAYLNVASDMEPQAEAEQSIRSGVSFKGSQLLVLIFADRKSVV